VKVHLNIGLAGLPASPFLPEQHAFLLVAGEFKTCAMEVLPPREIRWVAGNDVHRVHLNEGTLAVTIEIEEWSPYHVMISAIKDIAVKLHQHSIAVLDSKRGYLVYSAGGYSHSSFFSKLFHIPSEQA
jgi:hypothetical protein